MTLQAAGGRDEFLFDLTRWNRAGLSRFQYVDGDAAVWLEELRIALLGLYLRGIEADDRVPEKWRDLFLKPEADRQLQASEITFAASVAWKDLLTAFPVEVETGGTRNQRLLNQYDRQSEDYAWEIMRAFARAAHVLLGHQDAYANEGYLRTATQWENLRKLAAMVNYQPTPAASATTTVALELDPNEGLIEIARGLAMKYAPKEGGAPLIFETLKPFLAHQKLNAARTHDWNHNFRVLNLNTDSWIVAEKVTITNGDLAVVTAQNESAATSLSDVQFDAVTGQAKLKFNPSPGFSLETGQVLLLTQPDKVQIGLPRTKLRQTVIKIDGAASYPAGSIVEVTYQSDLTVMDASKNAGRAAMAMIVDSSGTTGNADEPKRAMQTGKAVSATDMTELEAVEFKEELLVAKTESGLAVVKNGLNGLLTLIGPPSAPVSGSVTVEALTPVVAGQSGTIRTSNDITKLYYKRASDSDNPVVTGPTAQTIAHGTVLNAAIHTRPADVSGLGYARIAGGKINTGEIVGSHSADIVRFEGAPPKSLSQSDWYVARPKGNGNARALRVKSIRVEADVYFIEFASPTPVPHSKTEFFGPMTQTLRPVDYDRDQNDAIVGGIATLQDLSIEAQNLVKAGRDIIVVDEKDDTPRAAIGKLTAVEPVGANNEFLKITIESDQDFSGWQAGWTKFCLNTVDVSHGESKDSKVLGSGDAEKRRQDFLFKIVNVSFIPSNASVAGVAPDMDVTVDGVKWEFSDIGDPTAKGTDSWSVALNEDNTLQIHFRRRLPTGSNNVSVLRHRVGVGASGTGVPPWSISKPMKKNRFVTGIVQPFTTAGGADREPVSDIRLNAPSKLAANGRAVSLKDFGRMCRRHSSVWQAKAREVISPGAANRVDIVIVPANGGTVTATLKEDLIDFVKQRTLPNTQITITPYTSLALKMAVRVNVDTSRYEKADVKEAVESALVTEFSLNNRDLGQSVYVAEILAAMERVDGVSSATISQFGLVPGTPDPLRKALISGTLAAIFPKEDQVVVLAGVTDVTVAVESLS